MTTIFIDTNIIYNESFFRSSWVESFLKACAVLQISVVIPEIVLDEVKGHFTSVLSVRKIAFQKAERELEKLINLDAQPLDVPAISQNYSNFLDEIMVEHGVIVAPYTEIPAKEIITKSYECIKPFKKSGDGHKDYLVWESVKSHILKTSTSSPNIMLTNNIKDFSKDESIGKNTLHPDLAVQIQPNHLRPSIQLSMKAVLDAEIMPLLQGLELEDIPSLGQPDIEHITNTLLLDDLPQRTAFGIGGVPFSNDISISSVGEAKIENVNLAKADDQVVIKISGSVEIEVDGFIEKFELHRAEEMSRISVWDHNWNDHVAAVSTSVETPFEISVFYSLDDEKVVGHEIVLPDEIEGYWE